jgi:hypothetical protein
MKRSDWLKRVRRIGGVPAVLAALSLSSITVAPAVESVTAASASDFLSSIGTLSAISVRGESLQKTIECTRYLGARWLRAGIEGDIPIQQFVEFHKQAGLRFSWGLGSGGSDIAKLIETGRQIETAGALLAFEGPNEPNNWGITWQGQTGGRDRSWMPVAKLQEALYQAVKSDPALKKYPVWSISEGGAETDNVGLQFSDYTEWRHADAGRHQICRLRQCPQLHLSPQIIQLSLRPENPARRVAIASRSAVAE